MTLERPRWSDRLPKSLDRVAHHVCLVLLGAVTGYLLLLLFAARHAESTLSAATIVCAAWYAFALVKFRLTRNRGGEEGGRQDAGA